MKLLGALLLLVVTAARFWMASAEPITADEAYYWMCVNQPDWAYFSEPGGTAAVARATSSVLGDSPIGLRFAFPLAAALATIAIILLGRSLVAPGAGAVAAVLLNVLPFFNLASWHISPALPTLTAVLFAAWGAWNALRDNRLLSWTVFGLAVSVGLHFHYFVALCWLALIVVCLASSKLRRRLISPGLVMAMLMTIAAAVPLLQWNRSHDWPFLALGTWQTFFMIRFEEVLPAFVNFALTLSAFTGALVILILVIATNRSTKYLRAFFTLAWSLPFFAVWLYSELHANRNQTDLLLATSVLLPLAVDSIRHFKAGRAILVMIWLLTAASTLTTVAFPNLIPHRWKTGANALPWQTIAVELESLRSLEQEAVPQSIFYIASNPEFTAALNYHLPRITPGEPREIYLRESQDLANQFGFWPRYDDFVPVEQAPDEFFTELKAENPNVGRTAIYVTEEPDLPQTIIGAFREVVPAYQFNYVDVTGTERTLRFYFCRDYQTMPL